MNKISVTNTVAYARIALIVGAGVLVFLHRLTLIEATAVTAFLGTALGSAGLFAAQEQGSPQVVQSTSVIPSHGDEPAKVVTSVTPPEGECSPRAWR